MAQSREVARRRLINKALRQFRASYRAADSAGERVERELDRLIKRKTTVEVDQIRNLERLAQAYLDAGYKFGGDFALVTGAIVNT